MRFILSNRSKTVICKGVRSLFYCGLFFLSALLAQAQYTLTTSTANSQITITGYTGAPDTLMIPDTMNGLPVTSISGSAFAMCALTSVSIGNNVMSIGASAFIGSNLTSLSLGSKVNSIGDSAFLGCDMGSVIFPANLSSIGNNAFDSCSFLRYVIFMGSNAPFFGTNVFSNTSSNFTEYCFGSGIGFSKTVINAGTFSPLTIWFISNGLSTVSNGLFSSPNLQSTPNGDGVNLLMAYALNLNPTQNQSARLPKPVFSGNQLKLTFYAGNKDVTYSVEASPDLKSWSTSGVTLTEPDVNGQVTASLPISGTKQLMRLKVLH